MFRVTARELGISPEDIDTTAVIKTLLPGNVDYLEGFNWTMEEDMYDPEGREQLGAKGLSWSKELKEVIIVGHRFERRPTYGRRPTFYHRCLITARELLRRGHEDGQYMPCLDLYMEFKHQFLRKGGDTRKEYEDRWCFYHVRGQSFYSEGTR